MLNEQQNVREFHQSVTGANATLPVEDVSAG
jgi:hypothetical protein